jgi:hypothetical protein
MDSLSTYNDFVVKLNISTIDMDVDRKTRSIEKHVKLKNRKEYGVVRDYVSSVNTNKILELLPENIKRYCSGVTKTSILSLPPHIHTRERCVINFYHKTNGEKTIFYDGEYEIVTDSAEDSGKGYYMVNEDKLKEVISYTASSGEVYLLNTRKAHSVIDTNSLDETRTIIQVFLDIPFSEAYKLLTNS